MNVVSERLFQLAGLIEPFRDCGGSMDSAEAKQLFQLLTELASEARANEMTLERLQPPQPAPAYVWIPCNDDRRRH